MTKMVAASEWCRHPSNQGPHKVRRAGQAIQWKQWTFHLFLTLDIFLGTRHNMKIHPELEVPKGVETLSGRADNVNFQEGIIQLLVSITLKGK